MWSQCGGVTGRSTPPPPPGYHLPVTTPAEPRPAASVMLVRPAPAGAAEPLEIYVIRRQEGMKFCTGGQNGRRGAGGNQDTDGYWRLRPHLK
jgi:hypothetical protein